MKKIIVPMIALFVAFSAYAQEKTPLLDSFQNMKTFEADFVQENYYPGIESYKYNGKIYVMRGEKALWDYETPAEFYLLEPGYVLHYSAELKQALRIAVDMNDYSEPSAILLGLLLNTAAVKDSFSVQESASKALLRPRKNIGVDSVELSFSEGLLAGIKSVDSAGNSISIVFRNVKQDGGINGDVFIKVLPEGTDFIEQ